jgi:hypothetical protein
MAKDRTGGTKPGSEASRDRDIAIRNVRDQLMQFIERKLENERGKAIKSLGPDVACMVEGLVESMAIVHFDFMRALANQTSGAPQPDPEPKLTLVRAPDRKK